MTDFKKIIESVQRPFVLVETHPINGEFVDFFILHESEGESIVGTSHTALAATQQGIDEWRADGVRIVDHRVNGGPNAS